MENLDEKLIVSRETLSDLKSYQSLLVEWQDKFNLVSKSSLPDAWNRHFLDSAQLLKYIPEGAQNMIDFGSGAGFPGLVLAVMVKNRTPYLNITLVESIRKKTLFLNEVANRLNLQVRIVNDRIENLPKQCVDVITSRAMCSLDKLLSYAFPFCYKQTTCLFPKGVKWQEELNMAKKLFNFDYRAVDSLLSEEGKILIITNIKPKGEKKCLEYWQSQIAKVVLEKPLQQ